MIEPVMQSDLEEIRRLIEQAVRANVVRSEDEAIFLIDDIFSSLDWWLKNPERALHLKCRDDERILGVLLIKDFWNLTNLFVLPERQGEGIGRDLINAGIEACRARGKRSKIRLYSSNNAIGFYLNMGFRQTGPGIDRPGGCLPFEYEL